MDGVVNDRSIGAKHECQESCFLAGKIAVESIELAIMFIIAFQLNFGSALSGSFLAKKSGTAEGRPFVS